MAQQNIFQTTVYAYMSSTKVHRQIYSCIGFFWEPSIRYCALQHSHEPSCALRESHIVSCL